MKVIVYWSGEAADAQGPSQTFVGIEWVCELPDQLILVAHDGIAERPPRYVIDYDDIAYWHETDPDVTGADEEADD